MKNSLLALTGAAIIASSCGTKNNSENENKGSMMSGTDKNGYTYEFVENDPMNVRIYTLKNGLKVYLSKNQQEPRIQTLISVKAGSTYDPKETTGLAHYLEHLMFKGTSNYGTSNWEEEEKLLAQISDLFEAHKTEIDAVRKKEIYAKIDSVSQEASKHAIANEYDKMIKELGGRRTNAYTSNEETVYMNDIPSNSLEKWIKLERERFGELVLRLFHTELETVYEEFNRGQASDFRKVLEKLNEGLYPNHPYGTQTTIGESEHLKNPSMVNIRNYWKKYYVPNNMAIILSGEFEFEKTIQMIDKYWGNMAADENLVHPTFTELKSNDSPVELEVVGPDAEFLYMAYRTEDAGSKAEKIATVLTKILSNSGAGMIDLNLVQSQKVLQAAAFSRFMNDYGMVAFYANARLGQELSEVKDLLLSEIEKIKKGEFEDWMLEAVLNDLKYSETKRQEENWRAFMMNESFLRGIPWNEKVDFLDEVGKITKQDIIDYANKTFKNNYVIVYKRTGEDTNQVKVEKPQITPIEINRLESSQFLKDLAAMPSTDLSPLFLDFEKDIKSKKLSSGITMRYINNKLNDLYSLMYVIDMGKQDDKKLALAFEYLDYIGTDKYSPAEIKQEFFKLGARFNVVAAGDRCYVMLNGIQKTFDQSVDLIEHLINNAKADDAVYQQFAQGQLKSRADNKLSKEVIQYQAMRSYAKYGNNNPFNFVLSTDELLAIDPNELTQIVKDVFSFDHHIFYYGDQEFESTAGIVDSKHNITSELKPVESNTDFVELDGQEGSLYFVEYDMPQVEVTLMSKDELFNVENMALSQLFNTFYGSGLSSIVFQEIRESKGYVYTAYANYSTPRKANKSHYLSAYVGTQADKMEEAVGEMMRILNEMPEASAQFEIAKESILKKIESERITKSNIFWTYMRNKDRGIDIDIRKDIYSAVQNATIEDMKAFFDTKIKGRDYQYLVIGKKSDVDFDVLNKWGNVQELTLEELFGY